MEKVLNLLNDTRDRSATPTESSSVVRWPVHGDLSRGTFQHPLWSLWLGQDRERRDEQPLRHHTRCIREKSRKGGFPERDHDGVSLGYQLGRSRGRLPNEGSADPTSLLLA
jgi:hypothetical protein